MSFHDFLAQHSSAGEFIVLVASCIPAALGTGKLLQEIKEDKGFKRAWRWTELGFLWLLPVMVFLSTKAVDWASDDALKEVRAAMQAQVDEAKAAALPKPFTVRLIAFLNALDSRILPALATQNVKWSGDLREDQSAELEGLLHEDGSDKFISRQKSEANSLQLRLDGTIIHGVTFIVHPKLLKDTKKP